MATGHFIYQATIHFELISWSYSPLAGFLHQKPMLTSLLFTLPSWVSTCVVGITVAVGVGVGTVAGVIMGLMLARGVGLFPGLTGCLLAEATTGVGLMLAVGGSEVLALKKRSQHE